MRPMLATVADRVPTGDAWVHEVKWDGMRVLVDVRDGVVTLWSRNERDVTAAYPELEGIGRDYDDMLLDGEVVALDGGRPSFHALTERMHVADRRRAQRLAATRPVTLMVFDLLRLFGSDLTVQPWSARRALLDRLDLSGRNWQVPEVYEDGAQLLAATKEQGLEGIVSKRRTSPYAVGRRSSDWRKTAHRASLSVVVGGWRPEVGSNGPDPDGSSEMPGRFLSGTRPDSARMRVDTAHSTCCEFSMSMSSSTTITCFTRFEADIAAIAARIGWPSVVFFIAMTSVVAPPPRNQETPVTCGTAACALSRKLASIEMCALRWSRWQVKISTITAPLRHVIASTSSTCESFCGPR